MNRVPPTSPLPSLLFGDKTAIVDRNAAQVAERISPVLPLRVRYEAIGDEDDFVHRTQLARINELELMAAATKPLHVDVRQSDTPLLIIPIQGAYHAYVDGKVLEGQAGRSACYLPASRWILKTEVVSVLVINLNRERMERLTRLMLGQPEGKTHPFDWTQPHQLDMHGCGLAFDRMFRQVGAMLDVMFQQPGLLEQSGLDDMVYRIVAMLLQPSLFAGSAIHNKDQPGLPSVPLAVACDYIRDNLQKRINLTDLQQVSGMSARNLQYVFQKQFGCTPMKWVAQQRLAKAREQLSHPELKTTVTAVATALRFSNLGNFSRLYQQEFGELPSATLERVTRS